MTLNDLETISSDIKVNKVNKIFPDVPRIAYTRKYLPALFLTIYEKL